MEGLVVRVVFKICFVIIASLLLTKLVCVHYIIYTFIFILWWSPQRLRLREGRLLARCHGGCGLVGLIYLHFVIGFVVLREVRGILLRLVPMLVVRKWHVGNVLLNDIRFFFMSAAVPPMLVWASFYSALSICALPLSVIVDKEWLVHHPLVPQIPGLSRESDRQRVPIAYLLQHLQVRIDFTGQLASFEILVLNCDAPWLVSCHLISFVYYVLLVLLFLLLRRVNIIILIFIVLILLHIIVEPLQPLIAKLLP